MAPRRLLILDTSFSYEAIVTRGLANSVTCRDLGGFFEHVWTVHPFASLVTSNEWGAKFGAPVVFQINSKHTFIEGKIGFANAFRGVPRLNFLFSQVVMLIVLLRLMRKEHIDVVRVGDALYLGLFGYLLSKLARTPFVVRVGANNQKIREITGTRVMPRLFSSVKQEILVERFVLSRANLVAGANKDNLQFAIDCGAKIEKCTLFRYGNLIDPTHFIPPKARAVPDLGFLGSRFLLCIARLEPVKKVDDVIRVLAEVRSNGFDVNLILVGEGRERSALERLAGELGVLDKVVFCGNRDQFWLSSVIPHADAVLSPHTGRALTEAALGAAPIVAYDVDWQAELIETGVTGELVTFGNWRELACSTMNVLKDRVYARKVGDNARDRAMEMMDPEKLDSHEIFEYNKLLLIKP